MMRTYNKDGKQANSLQYLSIANLLFGVEDVTFCFLCTLLPISFEVLVIYGVWQLHTWNIQLCAGGNHKVLAYATQRTGIDLEGSWNILRAVLKASHCKHGWTHKLLNLLWLLTVYYDYRWYVKRVYFVWTLKTDLIINKRKGEICYGLSLVQ